MAPVNPDIRIGSAPDTLGAVARPAISSFTFDRLGDRTGATALSGFGQTIKDVSTGAVDTIQSVIDQAINKGVDQNRDTFTGTLEQVAGIPQDQRVSPADANPNLLTNGANAPQPVTSGIASGTSLTNAFANGKLSPTYYTGQNAMLQKDLRAQFPGFRDYIDRRFAATTGGNPANDYQKELIAGINQSMQGAKDIRQKMLSELFQGKTAGYPGAATIADRIQHDPNFTPTDFVQWKSGYDSIFAKADLQKANLESLKADQGTRELVASNQFDALSNEYISHSVVTIGNKTINFDQLPEFISNIQSGKTNLDPKDLDALGQGLSAFKASVTTGLNNIAVQNGSSAVLQDKLKGIIDNKIALTIDPMIKAITDKDIGAAARWARVLKTTGESGAVGMMNSTNTTVANWARAQAALGHYGPNAGNLMLTYSIAHGLPQALQTVVDQKKGDIYTGYITLDSAIKNLHQAGVGVDTDPNKPNPANATARQSYMELTVGGARNMTNPKLPDEAKAAMFTGMFGPGNEGLSQNFAQDHFKSDGTFIPGQHAIISGMSSPQVISDVYKLNSSHPGVWDQYKVWFDNNSVPILSQDAGDLNNFKKNKYTDISYDKGTNQLSVRFLPRVGGSATSIDPDATRAADPAYQMLVRRKIGLVNSLLTPMAGIAKQEGTDPQEYIANRLNGLGFDIKPSEGKQSQADEPTIDMSAKSKPSSIKGVANVAHVGEEWGNPLSLGFQEKYLTDVEGPNGISFKANKKAAGAFKSFLEDLDTQGYKISSVGGYNLRTNKSDPRMLSQHAFGNAIDINPGENPYQGAGGKMRTNLPKNISEIAARHGLSWGGDWTSVKDPMHFEYVGDLPQASPDLASNQ